MTFKTISLVTITSLSMLANACSDNQTDGGVTAIDPEDSQGPDVQDAIEQIRRGEQNSPDQSQSFARLENCDLTDEAAHRIRVAEMRIVELLVRFTEQHPEVVAARRSLDQLVQAALDECVESIQLR